MADDQSRQGPVPIRTESFVEASRLLRTAALARAIGEPGVDRLTPLLQGRLALRPHTVDLAADAVVREAAHALLTHGWLPVEVHTFAARRLDATSLSYLVDALAATAQWSGAAAWRADLGQIRARVWWTVGEPHLGQWAARHGRRRLETMRIAVEVLALLSYLPRTDAPRPNSPRVPEIASHALVHDQRIVGKIDALLARANSSDFPDEAAACASKAQELMVRYATVPPTTASVAAAPVAAALRRLHAEGPWSIAKSLLIGVGRVVVRPSAKGQLAARRGRPLPLGTGSYQVDT